MLNGRQILIALAIKYKGDWESMYEAISKKDVEDLDKNYEEFAHAKCNAVTILDKEYPQILKQIYMPPFVLFYYGDISLTYNPSKCLAMVGTRNPSKYGEKMAEELASDLSKHFVIVSGMAKGIDGISHRSAIKAGNKTIAIIGSGIDKCYPLENRDLYNDLKTSQLILSEYFGDVSPDQNHFPLRNRIIAGLSKGTLIIEAKKHSGTSITAAHALSFSRIVMAVPNRADCDSACNRLIKEGAVLVETADDVIEELNQTTFVGEEIQENS